MPPRHRSALEARVPKKPKMTVPDSETRHVPYDLKLGVDFNVVLRAKRLAVYYQSIKFQTRWVKEIRATSQSFRSFIRAAQHLIQIERESCQRVSDIDYVLAHFWYWGNDCFTTRLSSSSSLALYQAFRRMQTATVTKDDPHLDRVYEDQMVAYLAEIRGETPETIRESLKDSGLLLPDDTCED